jgi:plastocyanin
MGTRRVRGITLAVTASACGAVWVSLLAAGCGGSSARARAPNYGGMPGPGGTITGHVTVRGRLPAVEPLHMGLDPTCLEINGATPVNDDLVVASDGAVANAFVYITAGLPPGVAPGPPATPLVVDQRGCRFVPHVLGVRAGQPIEFVNSDPTEHDVHAEPGPNGQFNRLQPLQGMRESHVFTEPDVMTLIKCDRHPWMSAYVGVMEHPYFAVTGADGRFTLSGVPDGHYTVAMWHERFGRIDREVAIVDHHETQADFLIDTK